MGAVSLYRIGQRGSNKGTTIGIEVTGMTAEMFERYGFCTIDAVAHLDGVEIDFHDAMFGPEGLDEDGEIGFECFACPRGSWPEEHVLSGLLADGTGSSHPTRFFFLFQGFFDGIDIESVMVEEVLVFAGPYGLWQRGVDAVERHPSVSKFEGTAICKLLSETYHHQG